LGFRTVPVVVLPGHSPLPGFNVKDLAAAIGAADSATPEDLATVVESFDRLLAAVLRATGQLSEADLDLKMPNRDRELRGLIHDVFYKTLTWAPESGPAVPRHAVSQREEAARYRDAVSLVRYGEIARTAMRRRFAAEAGRADRLVETADGPMALASAVTWLADHAAHHLRQVYWLMERKLGVTPQDPLDPGGLPGITLQRHLW
jgi:hypothetical protein